MVERPTENRLPTRKNAGAVVSPLRLAQPRSGNEHGGQGVRLWRLIALHELLSQYTGRWIAARLPALDFWTKCVHMRSMCVRFPNIPFQSSKELCPPCSLRLRVVCRYRFGHRESALTARRRISARAHRGVQVTVTGRSHTPCDCEFDSHPRNYTSPTALEVRVFIHPG